MKQNLLKIITIICFITCTFGCGKIPDSLREDEKNYMQMIEEEFSGIDFNILNDEKVQGNFTYEFKTNEVDVHIIDAELKEDSTFKFRICTGFSETATFTVEYDSKTNYKNILNHNNLIANFQNGKHITLKSETYTQKYYSDKCDMNYYKDTLVFNRNSSIEEIAQELASYDGVNISNIDFEYGNVNYCLNIYNDRTYENYVEAITKSIEDYNNTESNFKFCN